MSTPIESLNTDTALLEASAIHVALTFFPELMFFNETEDSYAPDPYFIPQSNPGIVQYFIPEGYGVEANSNREGYYGPLITVTYNQEERRPSATIARWHLDPHCGNYPDPQHA